MLLFARLASLLAVFANKRPVGAAESAGAQVPVESVDESRQVRGARIKKSVLRKSESFSKLESHFSSSSWRQGNRARRREKSQEDEEEPVAASCSAQVGDNLKCLDLACVGHEAAAKQLEDHLKSSLRTQEVQQVNKQQQQEREHAHQHAIDLHSVCGQLLTLICALLLLLYAIDFVQRQMANLFNKLLGSGGGNSNQQQDQRRRSLAAGSSGSNSSQRQAAAPLAAAGKINKSSSTRSIAQPQSSSQQQQQPKSQTLQSQQQTAAAASSRRSSRSSIHSLFSALIGGTSGNGSNASNGRSIIAKNKEDTVIASSPTIIQKEGSESSATGGQGGGGGGAPSPGASAAGPTTPSGVTPGASPQMNGPQLMNQVAAAAAASTVGSPLASILGVSQAIGAQQMRTGGGGGAVAGQPMTPGEVAELVLADQFLYDTARNPLNSITNVFALAAAAATEQPGSNNNNIAGSGAIVPSVSTQMARNGDELIGGGSGRGPGQQHHQAAGQQHPPQHPTHGQLSSSGTIKSAGGGPGSPVGSQAGAHSSPRASISSGPLATVQALRRHEIITHTELLLNALNQGDYDTYTRLCDPHMTSFEPENCGHLIDNMELRRLAVDQARQLQIHHHLATISGQQQQPGQQAIVSAVAMAAAAAAAAASISPAQGNNNTSVSQNSTSSGISSGAESQRVQQIALAAAQAALASLNLNSPTAPYQTSSSCASQQQQQQQQKSYSLMVNPQVCLLGDDGATIAYTKLSYSIDLASGQVARVEQSEETRVWLRRGPANDNKRSWACVHLHRSLVTSNNYNNDCNGPLTSLALLRAMGQQQRLAQLAEVQQQNVPSISLNNKGQQQPR